MPVQMCKECKVSPIRGKVTHLWNCSHNTNVPNAARVAKKKATAAHNVNKVIDYCCDPKHDSVCSLPCNACEMECDPKYFRYEKSRPDDVEEDDPVYEQKSYGIERVKATEIPITKHPKRDLVKSISEDEVEAMHRVIQQWFDERDGADVEVEDYFGLVYTDTSGFAALWNSNEHYTIPPNRSLRCFALTHDKRVRIMCYAGPEEREVWYEIRAVPTVTIHNEQAVPAQFSYDVTIINEEREHATQSGVGQDDIDRILRELGPVETVIITPFMSPAGPAREVETETRTPLHKWLAEMSAAALAMEDRCSELREIDPGMVADPIRVTIEALVADIQDTLDNQEWVEGQQ